MLALGFKDRARDLTFDMYGDWTLTDVEISPANPRFCCLYANYDIPNRYTTTSHLSMMHATSP